MVQNEKAIDLLDLLRAWIQLFVALFAIVKKELDLLEIIHTLSLINSRQWCLMLNKRLDNRKISRTTFYHFLVYNHLHCKYQMQRKCKESATGFILK